MKNLIIIFCLIYTIKNSAQGCVARVVCSDYNTTVYLVDGTYLSWGRNGNGQLGNGTTALQMTPTPTVDGNNWTEISHATIHTVALHQNGTVWAWGDNSVGQLGDGTTTNSLIPVQVGTDSDWTTISAGHFHTIALKADGTLWGWGNSGAFELTNGPYPFYHINPIQISSSTDWNKIYGCHFKTFGIKNNGTLWGIGRNNNGDLGVGNTSPLLTLTQIGTDTDWLKISAARESYTLALKTNGTLWAWGNNQNGRLGDGTTINRNAPVQIGNSTWKDVAAGNIHAIAIKTDGTLWQWGSYGGFLPSSGVSIPISLFPVQVGTDSDWKSVAAGLGYSYAVKEDNTLYAWGNGNLHLFNTSAPSYASPTLIPCSQLSTFGAQVPDLVIYPNPIKDELHISDITGIKSFEIYNALGQKVLQGEVLLNEINLSQLNKGAYYMVFYKNNSQFITHKFLKE